MKIAKSLIVIVAVLAVAAGATGAYFSDQASIDGNTFATGTLNLTLNHSAGKPFNVTNAYPGYWTNWEYMDVYNTGTLPFDAQLSLNNSGASNALWDNLGIVLETAGGDSVCHSGDFGEHEIYSGLVKNFTNGLTISDIAYYHLASDGDDVPVGYSERVCQKVGLDSGVGNEVQGLTSSFNEVVDATQD